MEVVQQQIFVNKSMNIVNEWLSKIPAENIVSTSWNVVCWEGTTDEFTTIFYKVYL